MPFLLVAALKDVRRRIADPAALLIWFGLPVVLGTLMALVSGGSSGTVPQAHVLLADDDRSTASRTLAQLAQQGPLADLLRVETVSHEDGQRRIDDGDGTALIVIPDGFQDGLLNDRPVTLTLVTNPSQRILPRVVEETLGLFVEAVFYAQRAFGDPIRQLQADQPAGTNLSTETVAAIGRVALDRFRTLSATVAPPLLRLKPAASTEAAERPGLGVLFLPGLIFMSVLLIAQGATLDIWTEKERGTLRRALTTPRPAGELLAAKVLAGLLLMVVVALVAAATAMIEFDVSLPRALLAFAWSCFAGVALFCYFLLLQMSATTQRGGSLLSSMVVFPVMMIGGSFFPFDAMPAWMASIGRWTPNGLAVAETREILFGTPDLSNLMLAALGIGLPAAGALWWASRRLVHTFAVK